MKALLDKGADPNAPPAKEGLVHADTTSICPAWTKSGRRRSGAPRMPATCEAMRLLVAHGADPEHSDDPAGRPSAHRRRAARRRIETCRPAAGSGGRPRRPAAAGCGRRGLRRRLRRELASLRAGGFLPAIKYLVEELGADVNAVDHDGNTAVHHAAARGDVESILYLVSKGADVTKVNREGQTTADMANGPVQRVQPCPEALAVLRSSARRTTTSASPVNRIVEPARCGRARRDDRDLRMRTRSERTACVHRVPRRHLHQPPYWQRPVERNPTVSIRSGPSASPTTGSWGRCLASRSTARITSGSFTVLHR